MREIQSKWWTKAEIGEIRKQILEDVDVLNAYEAKSNGRMLKDDGSNTSGIKCVRGLECRTAMGAANRNNHKRSARKVVRIEQQRQRNEYVRKNGQPPKTKEGKDGKIPIEDPEQLAYVCLMNNRACKEIAIEYGKLDELWNRREHSDYYNSQEQPEFF